MPTGYTAKLHDGKPVSFPEFVMDCARAFGANVMLRDEPGGGDKIPEKFEPSPWYEERAKEARHRLAELLAMTDEVAELASRNEWHEEEGQRQRRVEEMEAMRGRYEAMLLRVKAWVPPTPDHVGLQNFMVEQLESSIKFDCSSSYYAAPATRLSGSVWRARKIAQRESDLARYSEEAAKELERTNTRNAWNAALRESLR